MTNLGSNGDMDLDASGDGFVDAARSALEEADAGDDPTRLKVLEDLYSMLERELDDPRLDIDRE